MCKEFVEQLFSFSTWIGIATLIILAGHMFCKGDDD